MNNIRNFAIIAHIDHGKSTLADRFLELTGVVGKNHDPQLLDTNPISRERGITIKLAPVQMKYTKNNVEYVLNLIDTPGHVDFSYEVDRTLACVEGVILLVDATSGIQAQTIAHTLKALSHNLIIIPAINKVDMDHAQTSVVEHALSDFLGIKPLSIHHISAKTGLGVQSLLDDVIVKIPEPKRFISNPTKGLLFDSYYDSYRGVIAFVRMFEGMLSKNSKVYLFASKKQFIIDEVGIFTPSMKKVDTLASGEIGYIVTKLKDIHSVSVGDSVLDMSVTTPLPGYKVNKPMIYSCAFPTDEDQYKDLVVAFEKLKLNDASLTIEPVKSASLGMGFRVGFLGLLHADVVRERLEREYEISVLLTPPTVEYEIIDHGGKKQYKEPYALVTIVIPNSFLGDVIRIAQNARADFKTMENKENTVILEYEMPLIELISGFFDRLKTVTSGFGSLDWTILDYRLVEVDKMEIDINNVVVDELSSYVLKETAYEKGRKIVDSLKEHIPRQQFEIKIHARCMGRIIASSRIAPYRKDVTEKLYGGDRTRKDKLLKKQKKGKKMMKNIGTVSIPKETFLKVFSYSD